MKNKKNFGAYFYAEWLFPIKDYFFSTRKNELFFEVIMPLLISIGVTGVCMCNDVVKKTVYSLADVLVSLTSILIGFSVMLVTLLLTSGGDGVKKLQEIYTDKEIYGKPISLFQKLYIQFVFTLINEILLLLLVLVYYFFESFTENNLLQIIFLCVFVYLILNILLSIVRGITNVYFSYFNG